MRLQRVWHAARKYPEPVLRAEHPWERNAPVAFGTVLLRGGRFQMWYCAWTRHIQPCVCYAESDDGVHWTKPAVGLPEAPGGTEGNVVLRAAHPDGLIDDISVIADPGDRRWPLKALYWEGVPGNADVERGIRAARSSDGVRWEPLGMALRHWGDRFNAMAMRRDGRFVVLGRAPGGHDKGRVVFHSDSADLKRWTRPRLALAPDAEDPAPMQFYSATAFPWAGLLLGSIERMHMTPDVLDPELIWSRDEGLTWHRSRTRPALIARGAAGSFDSAWTTLTTNAPIVRGGEMWFYYSGRSGAHHAPYPHNHGAIGLATLRLDGFCSLQAREAPGTVLTPPVTWPDADLLVNLDPRRDLSGHPANTACGQLRVEVRTTAGKPVQGYALGDCAPLRENTARQPEAVAPVRWHGRKSLRALRGRRIRFLFELRDAHLYAWRARR